MKHIQPRHARNPKLPRRLSPWAGAVLCLALLLLIWQRLPLHAASSAAGLSVPSRQSPEESSAPQVTLTPTELPWNLRLVNRDNSLPQDFSVEVSEVPQGQLDSRAAPHLNKMLEDMEAQGLSPLVCSSFRTWEDQETLHRQEVESYRNQGMSQEEAEQQASRWVVPAGESEHQLGLAADIVAQGYQLLVEEQETTPEQQWLMAHCWEYGFILRYPKDKESITGVGYEPWHYRYVGKEAAQEITERGLCLEEYVEEQKKGGQMASFFSVGTLC